MIGCGHAQSYATIVPCAQKCVEAMARASPLSCIQISRALGRPTIGNHVAQASWFTTSSHENVVHAEGGPSASLLLGRAHSAPSAVVRQSNSVFAKIRDGLSPASQLVDALERLAAIGREASPEDLRELHARPHMKRLLDEIVLRLPRDTSEHVEWEEQWTDQITRALSDLRIQDIQPRLYVRLGNALLQRSSGIELDSLLRSVCDLCISDAHAPDTYTLWVLGTRLEELCQTQEPGELSMHQLVPILHFFAHPAIRQRAPARYSACVLKHLHHGLPACSLGELAQIIEAYADVPSASELVTQAFGVLHASNDSTSQISHANLRELTVVMDLSKRFGDNRAFARAVLVQLCKILEEDVNSELELAVTCAENATKLLASDEPVDAELFMQVVNALHVRSARSKDTEPAASGAQPPQLQLSVPPQAMISILAMGVTAFSRFDNLSLSDDKARWLHQVTTALVPKISMLSPAMLTHLAEVLDTASESLQLDPGLANNLHAVTQANAALFSPLEFSTVARVLASMGILSDTLLDAFDVEACLCKSMEPSVLANLAWAMACVDGTSKTSWALLAAQLEDKDEWIDASSQYKGLIYEALRARKAMVGPDWAKVSAASQLIGDQGGSSQGWLEHWRLRRPCVAPPSQYADLVESLLQALQLPCKREVEGLDKLYTMPLLLSDEKIIIDLLPVPYRHTVSRALRGEASLRHRVWRSGGYSVLVIPDPQWARHVHQPTDQSVEKESSAGSGDEASHSRQMAWLQTQLRNLRRADVLNSSGIDLDPEVEDMLKNVSFSNDKNHGINADGLASLVKLPVNLQKVAVTKFIETAARKTLEKPTGYLIGIVKKEMEAAEQKTATQNERQQQQQQQRNATRASATGQEGRVPSKQTVNSSKNNMSKKTTSVAAAGKPKTGWLHEGGRELDDATIGEELTGHVTNVMFDRVWVNVGFKTDATFKAPQQRAHTVGEKLERLKVVGINKEKSCLELKPMAVYHGRNRKERVEQVKEKPSQGMQPGNDIKDVALNKKTVRKTRIAAAAKPAKGWLHKGGKPLHELRVGEVVTGTVTNNFLGRVWVDIGAERDVTFWAKTGSFQVGEVVSNMPIIDINLEKNFVLIQRPQATSGPDKVSPG